MTDMNQDAVEKALEPVPNRPLSSLYDVAMLYFSCDLYERYTSEDAPENMSDEVLQALTPHIISHLFDPEQDNSLIVARVNLSGEEPQLGSPPVLVKNLTEELRYKIGFVAHENKTYKSTDYSISNHTGSSKKDIETIAHDDWGNRFLRGRLERWPDNLSDEIVDEYPLLQDLRDLGDDAEAMERLEEALLDSAEFDSTEAIVTVQVKLNEDEGYQYPGEIPALSEVAVRSRYSHLRDGLSVEDTHGPGVGYVSGEKGEVFGGSPGIRGQYGKLQVERFPNLEHNDAWLSRPVNQVTALTISNFDNFVSAFSFIRQGVRLHYFPYPVERVDAELFERFYTNVYQPLKRADDSDFVDELLNIYTSDVETEEEQEPGPLAEIVDDTSTYEAFDARDEWLRVYGLMYVGSTDPERVFVDEPSVDLDGLTALNEAYASVLADVGGSTLFGEIANQLGWLLPMESGLIHAVMFGTFFEDVTSASPDPDDETDENRHATSDDTLFTRYAKILQGTPLATESLLEEYATFLERQFRQNQQDGRESPFPTAETVAQYIQLRSLDAAGVLGGGSIISKGLNADTMAAVESNGEFSSREERLQAFLDSHEMLGDDAARSVFLLGALVGRLAAYQYNEGISQKMTEQYPPSAINRRSLPDITQDVLDRTYTYGDKDDRGRFNKRYTDRLTDSMLNKHPDDWDLSESEVKWVYALGVAYGKQDTSADIDYNDSDE